MKCGCFICVSADLGVSHVLTTEGETCFAETTSSAASLTCIENGFLCHYRCHFRYYGLRGYGILYTDVSSINLGSELNV